MGLVDRFKRGWNTFVNNRSPTTYYNDIGGSWSTRPDRPRLARGNERSIINSIFTRMSVDAASIDIKHVKLDEKGRYLSDMDSGLNECLTVKANIDQTGRAFRQDIFMTMIDEGTVAIVPVDTDVDPRDTTSYDIRSMRTGKVVDWYPAHVKVSVYNEQIGEREEVILPKSMVAIVENPFYAVMNAPNSTMQRLIRKLNLLDSMDEQTGSGKLDLIIQLPYVIKTDARRKQAEGRRKDIEDQLSGSKYGIAYTDGTEKITQLNRPLENNLLKQIEYLQNTLYSQLGITRAVMDGTADEKTMLNYDNRTIEPMVSAVTDGMIMTFLSKTARSQRQSIKYFRDPFRLVPVESIADIADKFTRNTILSANELRQIIGFRPSDDPKADELRNANLNHPDEGQSTPNENYKEGGDSQNGDF